MLHPMAAAATALSMHLHSVGKPLSFPSLISCSPSLLPPHLFSALSPSQFPSLALAPPLVSSRCHSFLYTSSYLFSSVSASHLGGLFSSVSGLPSVKRVYASGEARRVQSAVRAMSGASEAELQELVLNRNTQNPVVIYSKTWCPYCGMVKGLFNKLGVQALVVELDELVDESEVQKALQKLSGQSTVPNVFIGGRHIGGCDGTMALHERGELIHLLNEAGAKFA